MTRPSATHKLAATISIATHSESGASLTVPGRPSEACAVQADLCVDCRVNAPDSRPPDIGGGLSSIRRVLGFGQRSGLPGGADQYLSAFFRRASSLLVFSEIVRDAADPILSAPDISREGMSGASGLVGRHPARRLQRWDRTLAGGLS
jgi:hypothetical protein